MRRHPLVQLCIESEAAANNVDAIMARAIVRPDPRNPRKGNIRFALIGATATLLCIAATVLFAGV